MRKLPMALTLLVLTGCAPVSQKSDRLAEIEIKLTRLEQKSEDTEKDIERTNERIDKLTELISELRLEIEKLKLKLLTGASEEPAGGSEEQGIEDKRVPKPTVVQIEKDKEGEEPEDAESAYKKAIELYSVKKLYEARDSFLNFIKKFPENKFTDNAFFWIGKIYQELGDTKRAQEIYMSLVDKCEKGKLPDCNKLPDAYYQLMKISIDRGDTEKANQFYSVLIERFPTSDAAVRAREQKLLLNE